jgi:hypothetical protein
MIAIWFKHPSGQIFDVEEGSHAEKLAREQGCVEQPPVPVASEKQVKKAKASNDVGDATGASL